MLPYWALFGIVALAAMMEQAKYRWHRLSLPAVGFAVLLSLMIGLRIDVGGDYYGYLAMFEWSQRVSLSRALDKGDLAYNLLNWIVAQSDGDMWMVNLVCAAIFVWGLMRFCAIQPRPWLALVVAMPYLITVVAMGYTRQGVAIGIIMAGLASLGRNGSVFRFALYVVAATLFHRTALIILPFAIFAGERSRLLNGIAIAAIGYVTFQSIVSEDIDYFTRNYLDARMISEGAMVRVLMLVVPATILLLFRNRLGLAPFDRRLWTMVAVTSLFALPALYVLPSTTAVDRIALYLLPIQLVVLSRIPTLLRTEGVGRSVIIAYSALVLFVWLNFATHAHRWVPFKMLPFSEPVAKAYR